MNGEGGWDYAAEVKCGPPGVRIWSVQPMSEGDLRVEVEEGTEAGEDERVERAWAALCAANPRLHDGPILSMTSFDPVAGRIGCRRDSYKRLSVQDAVETGVVLLSVSAIVTVPDGHGREHVLLGRRSESTRIYGGMWELAPAGGLDGGVTGPVPGARLIGQLAEELREECGITEPIGAARPEAFCRDERACSFNIVYRVRLAGPLGALRYGVRHWDCDEALWLPVSIVRDFVRQNGEKIIAPTRALLRLMEWA